MKDNILVKLTDGSLQRKPVDDLLPEDRVVFDGPDAFGVIDAAQAKLDVDVANAGGLDAWRHRHRFS